MPEKLEPGFVPIWRSDWIETFSQLPPLAGYLLLYYRTNFDHRTLALPGYSQSIRTTRLDEETLRKYRSMLCDMGLVLRRDGQYFLPARTRKNPGENSRYGKNPGENSSNSPGKIQYRTGKYPGIDREKSSNSSTAIDRDIDKTGGTPASQPSNDEILDPLKRAAMQEGRLFCDTCSHFNPRSQHKCHQGHYSHPGAPFVALSCPDWQVNGGGHHAQQAAEGSERQPNRDDPAKPA